MPISPPVDWERPLDPLGFLGKLSESVSDSPRVNHLLEVLYLNIQYFFDF